MTGRVATAQDDQDDGPGVLIIRLGESLQDGDTMQPVFDLPLDRGEVRIAVDLSGPNYVGSTGLGNLLKSLRRARDRGGDIRLFAPSRFTRRTLAEFGLVGVLLTEISASKARVMG